MKSLRTFFAALALAFGLAAMSPAAFAGDPAIDAAIEAGEVLLLGPAEAPLAQVRGRWRYRILVHAGRSFDMQGWLRSWMKVAPKQRGTLRVQIDIDPQSFL